MIKKISFVMIFACLILAVFLSLNGITEINLSNEFYAFMKSVALQSYDINVEIPNIPQIPRYDNVNGLQAFINFWITLVNVLGGIINAIIYLLNIILSVVKFFVIIISNWKEFESALLSGVQQNSSVILSTALSFI